MGLADTILRRQAARRADPVSLEEFGYLLGRSGSSVRSKAGTTVSANAALGIPAWYRGAVYLSSTIARLPVHTFRAVDLNHRERRANPPWRDTPDVDTTWFGWTEHAMMALLHRGNSYSYKLRNADRQVVGLRPIHPDRVRVGRGSDGVKVFQIDHEPRPYTSREILHIPGPSYDGVLGLDPIRLHATALGIVVAAEGEAARVFGEGTNLRAYISMPNRLKPEDADRMRAEWKALHAGINGDRFGVIGDGATYNTIGLDPQQAQLLETRKYGTTQVAQIIGLPPHKLYDLERATFSNIEHQAIETVTDSLAPWVGRLEASLNADPDLLAGDATRRNFVEWQLEGLLRGDTAARFEAHSKATGRPWATVNETRRYENLAPIAGGDDLAVPLNLAVGDSTDTGGTELVAAIQKLYLGVGKVITVAEARDILNLFGAKLPAPPPALEEPKQ